MTFIANLLSIPLAHADSDWSMNGLVGNSYQQSVHGISGHSRDASGYAFLGSDHRAHPYAGPSEDFQAIITNNSGTWGFVDGKCIQKWELKKNGTVVCAEDNLQGSATDQTGLGELLGAHDWHDGVTDPAMGLNWSDPLIIRCPPQENGSYQLSISGKKSVKCGSVGWGPFPEGEDWRNDYTFNYSKTNQLQNVKPLFLQNSGDISDRVNQCDQPPCRTFNSKVEQTDKVVGVYYDEWARYKTNGRKQMYADQLPFDSLTHLLYAFIPVCGKGHGDLVGGQLALCTVNDCGVDEVNPYFALERACSALDSDYKLVVHDAYAATGATAGKVTDENGTYQVYPPSYEVLAHAKEVRKVSTTILPSIGGWSLSKMFFGLHNTDNMNKFVASCEDFLRQWTFYDGIDIDWEFPGGGGADSLAEIDFMDHGETVYTDIRSWKDLDTTKTTKTLDVEGCSKAQLDEGTCPNNQSQRDGVVFVTLMKKLRQMLDRLGSEVGKTYQLSAAVSAGSSKIAEVPYGEVKDEMDHIFLMSYDLMGAWSNDVGHQANLYPTKGVENLSPANFESTAGSIDAIRATGFPGEKLVVGVAMYGRGWKGTVAKAEGREDFIGGTVSCEGGGTCPCDSTNEAGVVDYAEIADWLNDGVCTEQWDECAMAPLSVCNINNVDQYHTYDNVTSVFAKGTYVHQNNLGGLFSWVISQDDGKILDAMNDAMNQSGGYQEINRPAHCSDGGPTPTHPPTPSTTTKAPESLATTSRAPATTTRAPATTTRAPATTTRAPATTTRAPATTTRAPTTTTKATTSAKPTMPPAPGACVDGFVECPTEVIEGEQHYWICNSNGPSAGSPYVANCQKSCEVAHHTIPDFNWSGPGNECMDGGWDGGSGEICEDKKVDCSLSSGYWGVCNAPVNNEFLCDKTCREYDVANSWYTYTASDCTLQ